MIVIVIVVTFNDICKLIWEIIQIYIVIYVFKNFVFKLKVNSKLEKELEIIM